LVLTKILRRILQNIKGQLQNSKTHSTCIGFVVTNPRDRPNQTKPNQTKPNQTKPNQTKAFIVL